MVKKTTKKKGNSSVSWKILVVSLLVIIAVMVHHLIVSFFGVEAVDMHLQETDVIIRYNTDMHADFHSYGGNNFFFVTREHMQFKSSTGDDLWQYPLSLSVPIMASRGETVAVGEERGRRVYVFNAVERLWYRAEFQYPVIFFSINRSGYLSVILSTDAGYEVRVHSPGYVNEYLYRNIIPNANRVPIAVDTSEDGRLVAISVLDVGTNVMTSRVLFSFTRDFVEAQPFTDGLISIAHFPGEFVFRIHFTECGRALVFTDRQIVTFMPGMQEDLLNEQWRIPLRNQLGELHIHDNGFAYVTGVPFLNQRYATPAGVLHMYDFEGEMTGSLEVGRQASPVHLSARDNAVLLGMGRTFYAVQNDGTRLWTYIATLDVHHMIFLENTDTVLLGGINSASVRRRTR